MIVVEQQKTLLRQLRRTRELTIDALARDTGINVSTLSRGERGLIPFTDAQLDTLAAYFDVSKEDLLRAAIVRTEVA